MPDPIVEVLSGPCDNEPCRERGCDLFEHFHAMVDGDYEELVCSIHKDCHDFRVRGEKNA